MNETRARKIPPKRRLTRRRFLIAACGAAVATPPLLLGYTAGVEPHWLSIVRRDLPIGRLPAELAGRRLVHITDLHVGRTVDSDYLRGALRTVSSLEPDLVAITGDFMSCVGTEHVGEVLRVMEHLNPARLATLAVLGNHDYGLGWRSDAAADKLVRGLADLGVRVLRNECCDVVGLRIAGIDDLWGPHFDASSTTALLDPARPGLLLCHNPDACDLPVWNGYRGWVLAGHTHGGQCKPPFLPPPILPVRNRRYTRGAFDLHDGRWLYINPGLGYLRRVRFNVRPEITVFTLRRAEEESLVMAVHRPDSRRA